MARLTENNIHFTATKHFELIGCREIALYKWDPFIYHSTPRLYTKDIGASQKTNKQVL